MVIKYTKKGQPYTILANGRARFIKGKRQSKNTSRGVTMAKKGRFKRIFSKAKSSASGLMPYALSGIYGATRNTIYNGISKTGVPNMLPVPETYKDEATMILSALLLKLAIKKSLVQQVTKVILLNETYRVGELLGGNIINKTSAAVGNLFDGGGL